MVIFIKQVLQL